MDGSQRSSKHSSLGRNDRQRGRAGDCWRWDWTTFANMTNLLKTRNTGTTSSTGVDGLASPKQIQLGGRRLPVSQASIRDCSQRIRAALTRRAAFFQLKLDLAVLRSAAADPDNRLAPCRRVGASADNLVAGPARKVENRVRFRNARSIHHGTAGHARDKSDAPGRAVGSEKRTSLG